MNFLVSVIIPTYNHANFLAKAIKSVLDQTYTNFEIIVIDNHSTDNSDEVVNSFNDARLKLLKVHNNGVIAISRNKGILEAKGDWIAFLDSDDIWYPKKLETVMNVSSQNKEFDVLSTNEVAVNFKTGDRSILRYGPYEKNFYKALLLNGNRLSPSATLINHSFLKEKKLLFNESEDYIAVEDYDLWLKLAQHGAKFKFLESVHGEYFIHQNNNSSQLLRQRINYKNLLLDHVFKIQKFNKNPHKLWNHFIPHINFDEIKQLIADGYKFKAFAKLMHSFFHHPFGMFKYIFMKLRKKL